MNVPKKGGNPLVGRENIFQPSKQLNGTSGNVTP